MKKLLLLLLVLSMLGVSAALAEEEPEPHMPVIMLECNRTTGFDWSWEVDHEDIVEILCEYAVNWQPASEGDIMPPGTGGCSKFMFAGIAPGEATITFSYRRPWEEKESLYILCYLVHVDEDLNVTILGSSFDW